jgi:hypothetical protein
VRVFGCQRAHPTYLTGLVPPVSRPATCVADKIHARRSGPCRRRTGQIEAVTLLALAVVTLGVVVVLARTIHERYRCADEAVRAGTGGGGGCGSAGEAAGVAPPPGHSSAGGGDDAQPTGDTRLHAAQPPFGRTPIEQPSVLAKLATRIRTSAGAAGVRDLSDRARGLLGLPRAPATASDLMTRTSQATDADVYWLHRLLSEFPQPVLAKLRARGVTVVAAHDSVTEKYPSLEGGEIGFDDVTYEQTGGLYAESHRTIVVPVAKVWDHRDVVAHEIGHALDEVLGHKSRQEAFIEARNQDLGQLGRYERQAGERGLSETYAEAFASYVGGHPMTYPNLYEYFRCEYEGLCAGR